MGTRESGFRLRYVSRTRRWVHERVVQGRNIYSEGGQQEGIILGNHLKAMIRISSKGDAK